MKTSLREKLEGISLKYHEIEKQLADPNVYSDQKKFKDLSVEFSKVENIVKQFNQYNKIEKNIEESKELLGSGDNDIKDMAENEIKNLKENLDELLKGLELSLLPEDPNDENNVFLEIRAGTGGLEAALFAGDLFKMYCRYAERNNWNIEKLTESPGDHGGFKQIVIKIIGKKVYSNLKFESGAHRVQRVPETESQGRVHTSAATVAVLPEVDEIEDVEINNDELRIDTFRASGAGGQHVNKTDSAIRITHLPTGCVVECQDDRSQHKNKAKALNLLKAKLLDIERNNQIKEQSKLRKSLVGSGDRSERIRTYNFPQGRITDHRINITMYNLEDFLDGNIQNMITSLVNEYQAQLLIEENI